MGDCIIMSYEEEKAVEELGIRIKNDLTPAMREDDSLLYRFLKAKDFDVDKAENFLRKNITWRKAVQVDTILENFKPNEFYEKYAKACFVGYDKVGDILLYNATGTFNVNEVFKSMKMNNFMKHYVWNIENGLQLLEKNCKKTGIRRHQIIMIFDLDKLDFRVATSKLSVSLFLRIIDLIQNGYPERLKYMYVINAPNYFVYIFSILKTVMSSTTVKKVLVFDSNGWKESLLELVDPDVLPAFLGGNRTDPDGNPRCTSFINLGGKIPEKYFLTDEERFFQSNAQIKTIIVPRQDRKEINVHIKREGLLLKWAFLVQNKDNGFGLSYRKSESEIIEILPVYRYDTSDGTEEDAYKCPLQGTYIIIFDNSMSWLYSKSVQYSIDIENTTAYGNSTLKS